MQLSASDVKTSGGAVTLMAQATEQAARLQGSGQLEGFNLRAKRVVGFDWCCSGSNMAAVIGMSTD